MTVKGRLLFLLAAGALALSVGCRRGSEEKGGDARGDEVVLAVGNRSITLAEFHKDLERAKRERGIADDTAALSALKESLVRDHVRTELILTVARAKGISVSHEEVAAEIARIRKSYPGETFREMLAEQYIAYDVWVDRQKERLTVEKVVAEEVHSKIEVADGEVKTFFAQNAEWAQEPEQFRVLQLLVSTEAESTLR